MKHVFPGFRYIAFTACRSFAIRVSNHQAYYFDTRAATHE